MTLNSTAETLTGKEVLRRAQNFQERNVVSTLHLLDSGQLGVKAPQTWENLGNALLLLTQLASCEWGCRGDDHTIENLVRRACNYAFAAIRLSTSGLYDEALGLVRGIAEIVNLLQLFFIDITQLDLWRQTSEENKSQKYRPVKVREMIVKREQTPLINQDTYSKLCEIGVHASPNSIRFSHDLDKKVFIGGDLSPTGMLLVINQLTHCLTPALVLAGVLANAPESKLKELIATSEALLESASWLSVDNYENLLNDARTKHGAALKERALHKLSQLSQQEGNDLFNEIVGILKEDGSLPEDLSSLSVQELQDTVFPHVFRRLLEMSSTEANDNAGTD